VAVVWFALTLLLLLGFVGVAVDLSNWWRVSNNLQASADAAALAGVVRLPGDLPAARDEAVLIAAANGNPIANAGTDISLGANPAQLRVTTSATVTNSFLGLIGLGSTTIRRTGTAEYQGPVPMGSPENLLGSDPDQGANNEWWLSMGSQLIDKSTGDRFASGGVANTEYDANGYFFRVRVTGNTNNRDLVIHAFDPAWIEVGDRCEDAMPDQAQANALEAAYGNNNAYDVPNNPLYTQPYFRDAATRFAPGPFTPFCAADAWSGDSRDPGITVFTVRKATVNSPDPATAPAINTATCQQNLTFAPVAGPLYPHIDPADPGFTSPTSQYVRSVFRRWVPICRIELPEVGDYLVQVQRPEVKGSQNRYSLRAGLVPDGSNASPNIGTSSRAQVSALARLPMFVNAQRADGTSATPTFYLAEVPQGSGGRVLTLEFWDIGDVQDGTTTFELLAPNGTMACTFTPLLGAASASGCQLSAIENANYNGVLVTATIELPSNYTCSPNPNIGCWFRIRMTYSAGAKPLDTTTWQARLGGDPIRLVHNLPPSP
jgi:hypothetical protein